MARKTFNNRRRRLYRVRHNVALDAAVAALRLAFKAVVKLGAISVSSCRRAVTTWRTGFSHRNHSRSQNNRRPHQLAEFVGQEKARTNLAIFIDAARARREALDHVLFAGPPGLGKTTLAQIVAHELGVNFCATSGPMITKASDLIALLTSLKPRDVLFIDEIHQINPAVEEVLYPAMEDFKLDLIIREGRAARSVNTSLAPFTLIGATTRAGLLTNPLRDRFGIPVRLDFYSEAELEQIISRGACVLGLGITPDGANEIARRARGTPRTAGRLLRRVRDFAHIDGAEAIDRKVADRALGEMEVDAAGMDALDRRYLRTIAESYGGGPVGVDTLAAALSEPRDTIEDIIEPFLIQKGFLQRTPRGRLITSPAFKHLGIGESAPSCLRGTMNCPENASYRDSYEISVSSASPYAPPRLRLQARER